MPENPLRPANSRRPGRSRQRPGERLDEVIPPRRKSVQPVVGLGGSAGSLSALRAFFAALPVDSGLAFVVVTHLAPDRDSNLAALLQSVTPLPVLQVHQPVRVEANCVYVIPPGKALSVADDQLHLSESGVQRGQWVAAVDLFFRTLADALGPQATAIILSGADGDGAIGLKRVKERGGLTIAQEPQEAEQNGMPRAAIATGMVDWVLPVTQMPARLTAYYARGDRLRLPAEGGGERYPAEPAEAAPSDAEVALREVLGLVRARTGHDFSDYKRATLLRRLARRLQINGLEDLPAYREFLRTHPGEAGALLQDLLISVTNFFRDPEAFAALEADLPRLFAGKTAEEQVRVWVAGCATGEEAYSIGMLLAEQATRLDAPPALQVFATDLDEAALRAARMGLYPETIAADVSEERLRRFFVRDARAFRVRPELREVIVFAAHNLLKDSPFSRLDLISCRNLLIYLNPQAQERVLDTFHFALNPAGRLLLGASEAVGDGDARFMGLDKKHRLYASRALPPATPGSGVRAHAVAQPGWAKARPALPGRALGPEALPRPPGALVPGERTSWAHLHFKLVDRVMPPSMRERFTPPSLIVDREYNIVHRSGQARSFLPLANRTETMNLLGVVHPALRIGLGAALGRALETGAPSEVFGIPVELEGQARTVDVRVTPVRELGPDFLLVIFDDREPPAALAGGREGSAPDPQEGLARELDEVKAGLQDAVEQRNVTVEELQAGNEELQAMNEELQAAGEELETSREELQSINEELSTVNQELKHKVDELSRANSDLQNLMAATDIATIFLDRQLRIQRYTPAAVRLFSLIATDLGRPLSDLSHQLEDDFIAADAQRVLETLVPIEREKRSQDGRWYLVRLLPYRTPEDRIAGVALTLVDITARKTAEAELLAVKNALDAELAAMTRLHELSARLLTAGPLQPLLEEVLDAAMELQGADFGAVQLLNHQTGALEIVAQRGFERAFLEHFAAVGDWAAACGRALRQGARVIIEDLEADPDYAPHRAVAAAAGHRAVQSTPLFDRLGQPLGVLSTHFRRPHRPSERDLRVTDLYARQVAEVIGLRRAEHALRASEARWRLMVEGARDFAIFTLDSQNRITSWNPGAEAICGHTAEEALGQSGDMIFTPEDRAGGQPQREMETARREGRAEDERWHLRKDGRRFWASGVLTPMAGPDHQVTGFLKILRDRTEVHQAEQARRQAEERLALLARSVRDYAIFLLDPEGRVTHWNEGAARVKGYSEAEALGQHVSIFYPPEQVAAGVPERQLQEAAAQGRSHEENWRVRKGGERFWAEELIVPLREEANGELLGFAKICRDLTERKAAEQERERLLAAAEAANRAKDRFLAALSHELRTPLTPVQLALFSLQAEGQLSEAGREAVAMIGRNLELERQLIDDLLDVNRIVHGKLELRPEPVNLHGCVRAALEVCRSALAAKGLQVTVELKAANPTVSGDAARLQQVFWNLLHNAAKFTPDGGAVTLRSRDETDGSVAVEVADTGAGIAPELLSKLFDPFEQGSAEVGRRHGGLGLGLAICHGIVQAHGGRIWAASAGPGQGATFTVELPGALFPAAPPGQRPAPSTGKSV